MCIREVRLAMIPLMTASTDVDDCMEPICPDTVWMRVSDGWMYVRIACEFGDQPP